jgi:hypothetical protein
MEKSPVHWGFPLASPGSGSPAPHLLVNKVLHLNSRGAEFHDVAVAFGAAHRQHPRGVLHACYGSWIGAGEVRFMYPLASPDEPVSWPTAEEVVVAVHGSDAGPRHVQVYRETVTSETKIVFDYRSDLSLPGSPEATAPWQYLVGIEFRLSAGRPEAAFVEAVKSVVGVHRKRAQGLRWATYASRSVGSPQFYVMCPASTFADIDRWPDTRAALADDHGAAASDIFDQIIDSIGAYQTTLLVHVPACGYPG